MCGIYGMISRGLLPYQIQAIEKVFDATKQRGRDGSNLIVGQRNRLLSLATASTGLFTIAIGNSRAMPTSEWVDTNDPKNWQPFVSPDQNWVVAHNGTIANDKELAKTYLSQFERTSEVDTWVVPALLQATFDQHYRTVNQSVSEIVVLTIAEVLKKLIGSFAFTIMHKPSARLFYATNYKPLYLYGDDDGFVQVTSLESFFDRICPSRHAPRALPQYSWGEIHANGVTVAGSLYEPKTQDKTVVVCSGGLDSTVVAAALMKEGHQVQLLHFDYAARAGGMEQLCVHQIAKQLKIPYRVIDTDFFRMHAPSVLTNTEEGPVNTRGKGEEGMEFAHEWVPARNTIMLSLAAGYAEANGCNYIALGNNMEESGAYPDNEQEFIKRWNSLLPYVVRAGHRMEILEPVGALVKHEIVKLGLAVGAPLEHTWSCYFGGSKHCGTCGPCYMRKRAFKMNGVKDPVFAFEWADPFWEGCVDYHSPF